MNHPFQAGGALLTDSPVYVERKADHGTLAHLRNMAYLLVIEPRQQGKTSLINHLTCHPALDDVAFASSTLQVASPAIPLIWDGDDTDRCILAVWEGKGQGRVLCLQHEGYFSGRDVNREARTALLLRYPLCSTMALCPH